MASARRPRRARTTRLGQHFLHRPERCAQLVATAGLSETDCVVEIGAGRGALTGLLAERARRVIAVEFDPGCVRALRAAFGRSRRIDVVEADFLQWPLPRGPYKVFANPPFGHTAAIVRRLTESDRPPEEAWLVLEDAAARRFTGAPWAPETLRSLLLKPAWHLELRAELGPGDFSPPAARRCALLWMSRRQHALIAPDRRALWNDFVAHAFGRHGNVLERCLQGVLTREQVRRCARSLRFDAQAAPSALGFEQWLGLFRCFEERAGRSARRRVRGALERLPR